MPLSVCTEIDDSAIVNVTTYKAFATMTRYDMRNRDELGCA